MRLLLFLPWEAGPISLPSCSSSLLYICLSPSLLPRLESHAYTAADVRGVNPRELPGLRSVAASLMIASSRALPFCRRISLSLSLSLSIPLFLSVLRRRLRTRPRAASDQEPRENARLFARLLLETSPAIRRDGRMLYSEKNFSVLRNFGILDILYAR